MPIALERAREQTRKESQICMRAKTGAVAHARKNAKNACFSESHDKIVHTRDSVHVSFKLEIICTVFKNVVSMYMFIIQHSYNIIIF